MKPFMFSFLRAVVVVVVLLLTAQSHTVQAQTDGGQPQVHRNVTMVYDLNAGHLQSSSPTQLTECHGWLYFEAGQEGYFTDFSAGLYKYDGPNNVITKVKSGERHGLFCFHDILYYFMGTGTRSWGLYQLDRSGVEQLFYDMEQAWFSVMDLYFAEFQSQLYFGKSGPKLLRTDGITVEVAWDLQTGWNPTNSEPQWFAEHEGELYFICENEEAKDGALWKFDGTQGSLVADLAAVTGDSSPTYGWLTSYKKELYFQLGHFSGKGQMLVKWDGTSVVIVNDVPGLQLTPTWLTVFQDELYMRGYARNTGNHEVWKYDGEYARLLLSAKAMYNPSMGWFTPFDNSLFFTASDGTIPDSSVGLTTQLWVMLDGQYTEVVQETFPYEPSYLTPYQGRLFFAAGGDATGNELWVYTPDGWEQPEGTVVDDNGTDGTVDNTDPVGDDGNDTSLGQTTDNNGSGGGTVDNNGNQEVVDSNGNEALGGDDSAVETNNNSNTQDQADDDGSTGTENEIDPNGASSSLGNDEEDLLSTGGIVGVVFGVLVVSSISAGITFLLYEKCVRDKWMSWCTSTSPHNDPPLGIDLELAPPESAPPRNDKKPTVVSETVIVKENGTVEVKARISQPDGSIVFDKTVYPNKFSAQEAGYDI